MVLLMASKAEKVAKTRIYDCHSDYDFAIKSHTKSWRHCFFALIPIFMLKLVDCLKEASISRMLLA